MKNPKEDLARAIGKPFTTKTKTARALGYKDYHSVNKFFLGVEKINGTRYYTYGIVEKILERS